MLELSAFKTGTTVSLRITPLSISESPESLLPSAELCPKLDGAIGERRRFKKASLGSFPIGVDLV